MDATGSVLGVIGRPTSTGRTVYDVQAQLDDGQLVKLGTFKAELAQSAQNFQTGGQRVSIRYDVRVKGEYTNLDLVAIAPEGQLPAAPALGIQMAGSTVPVGQPTGKGTPETQKQIVKQNVLRTAHDFVGGFYQGLGPDYLEEAEAHAERIAQRLYGIVSGSHAAAVPVGVVPPVVPVAAPVAAPVVPIVPTATTPAEVAAAVPGVQVGVDSSIVPASGADIAWD